MAKKKGRIIKYRRPLRFNIGIVIAIMLMLYMALTVYTYLNKAHVSFYEVTVGSIVNSNTYNGIVLREEQTVDASSSGYVNFYVRDGKRVSVGSRVYSIDETGNLKNYLEENPDAVGALSSDNVYELKKLLSTDSMTFSNTNFNRIYDDKYTIETKLSEFSGTNAMANLDGLLESQGITYSRVTSTDTGVVSFEIDGYEDKTVSDISAADFNDADYKFSYVKSGDLVESGAPVYKLITSEDWCIAFEVPDDMKTLYADKTTMTIKIDGTNKRLTGSYKQEAAADGTYLGVISFDKYMVDYLDSRYIKFEVDNGEDDGLKIPKTAVTDKVFFTVPEEYLTVGGDSLDEGFYKEVYDQDGTTVTYIPTTVFFLKDGMYYIDDSDDSEFKSGDYIVKPDSTDRYQIGSTASLQGVYNINKGYAVFKQIDIITGNDEYYTVSKGMKYGLSEYDHIMLDATGVSEGEFIYN